MSRVCWSGFVLGAFVAFSIQVGAEQTATAQEQSRSSAPVQETSGKKAEALKASNGLREIDIAYADAMNLFEQNRHFDAAPLLEKLIERYPSDLFVTERLGISLIMTNVTASDAEARKQQRARGRQLLVWAKELGADSDIVNYYISTIPEDGGGDTVFSGRKEVNEAMQEGEKAFARNNFSAAIESYTRAMLLDPNLYPAVLFIGDSFFASRQYENAGEWFLRATKVDPNKETAYRYWGDALMRQGKMDEALSKFIEAIIAEPYTRSPWLGLKQWADSNKVPVGHPDIRAPQRPQTERKEGGPVNITINVDGLNDKAKKDGTSAWMTYQIMAGAWQIEAFKKKPKDERQYRHTLEEEEAALSAVASSVKESLKGGELKSEDLDPGISMLLKLYDAEMLEPFILFSRADEGIAKDYDAYREKNRDKLRRYLKEFVLQQEK